jgi:hypothetical protein
VSDSGASVDLYWIPLGADAHVVRASGKLFRYEIRRWRGGSIPDVGRAIESPVRLTDDLVSARRLLDLLPSVPTPIWGRDELKAGEMWNSNSVVAWALASSGLDVTALRPPTRGRAPGWNAGLVVAARALDRRSPPRIEVATS